MCYIVLILFKYVWKQLNIPENLKIWYSKLTRFFENRIKNIPNLIYSIKNINIKRMPNISNLCKEPNF